MLTPKEIIDSGGKLEDHEDELVNLFEKYVTIAKLTGESFCAYCFSKSKHNGGGYGKCPNNDCRNFTSDEEVFIDKILNRLHNEF